MRVLVIHSHPVIDSFSGALRDAASEGARAAGHDVRVLDLGAMNFNPVMSADELRGYKAVSSITSDDLTMHIDSVKWADVLVFVYPTWWSTLPAQLKGWLERVMRPGVAFVFDEDNKVRPGLRQVRTIVGITTYGSKWPYVKLMKDSGRRTLLRALKLNTSWRTRSKWLAFYGIDGASEARRAQFLGQVRKSMETL
ncbi:MAG: NAD(P)H-dependent oxidoreductase [Actinobacteria bacterium]|nr:NAD(P)H-dependent oxidoreductase [Actinomycetota bacterium]